MKKSTLAIFLVLTNVLCISAQNISPIMVISSEGETEAEAPKRLALSTLDIDARILGTISETVLTMTFFNPSRRVIAGDLYVPLPENAVLSGYALDIEGVMVDGVPVEKQKGREVFEKIVRQGIDPGLVEWTKGNTFKTRVFPIPALGSRTIRIKYTADVEMPGGVPTYHLPMNYTDPVRDFSIRVEVVKTDRPPTVRESGFSNFRFTAWRSSFVAETQLSNALLNKDVYISLPSVEQRPVVIERDSNGEYFFSIAHTGIQIPGDGPYSGQNTGPDRIALYWDASGSRTAASMERSFRFLRQYFGNLGPGTVTVDCIVFRNESEEPGPFRIRNGDVDELIEFLEELPYDGGTQMGAVRSPEHGTDFAMLFSDGVSNFGSHEPPEFGVPLYVLCESTVANYPYLKYLAMKNNGEFFNLNTTEAVSIVPRIGKASFNFLRAKIISGSVPASYPQLPQPVHGNFRLSGQLTSPTAQVTLQYGRNGRVETERTFTITRDAAAEGELIRIVWAQDKLNDLLIFPDRNSALISDLGKEFGLVTPGTSLIVLDNLDQYVEYKIPPPKSLPEMRRQYFKLVAAEDKKEKDRQKRKIDDIIVLWEERINWWNTVFKYDKDFPISDKKEEMEEGPSSEYFSGAEAPEAMDRVFEEMSMEEAPRPAVTANGAGGEDSFGASEKSVAKEEEERGPVIEIKPWDPSMPYLEALKAETRNTYYREYLNQKKEYGSSPAFYLDCADFFFNHNLPGLGLRILSNLAELELENPALLRILAHRLEQQDILELSKAVFQEVLRMRPEEPQSFRDLALVLGRLGEYNRGIELLYRVILGEWDRFHEIELVAMMEMNNMVRKAREQGMTVSYVDRRLIKMLDVDIRIVLTWDADMTDMDLWVIEPSGEQNYYGNPLTVIGGHLSRDFTDGYGPEEYMLKKAMDGIYDIKVDYFSSSAPALTGSVTLQAVVFTNYGRTNEKRQAITVRLRESEDVIDIGEIEF